MSSARAWSGWGTALVLAAGLLASGGTAVAEPVRSATSAASAAVEWPYWPPQAPATLTIDTAGVEIGRDDYVAGTVSLDGLTHVTEVRGRGNSTWKMPKKPYKLKLEADAALVGDQAYDEWVLLAGYADRSALRTAAAFAISAQTSLVWTPHYRYVDVVLNGQSQGLYLLTEQVEVGEGRVDLPDEGYLLEFNKRYLRDDEPGFRTRRGTAIAFKDPDEVTKKQRLQVTYAIRRFERVLYGSKFADPQEGYAKFIDVKRVIDWYLVEELFRNQDSNFQSSVHFSWIPGEKFVFGPVWDFDLSAGTRWKAQATPDGWLTRVGTHWVARMLEDPKFSERVKSRWARLRPVVDGVVGQIPAAAAPLAASAEADWKQWHEADDLEWTRHARGWKGEVSFLQDWLSARAQWLSRNEVRLGATRLSTQERERTVWVPVQLQSAPSSTVSVDYDVLAGTATAGSDFVAESGRIDFAPGQVLRYVPVRVLDDADRERRETVLVQLREVGGGPVLGSPNLAKVGIARSDR